MRLGLEDRCHIYQVNIIQQCQLMTVIIILKTYADIHTTDTMTRAWGLGCFQTVCYVMSVNAYTFSLHSENTLEYNS